MAPGRLGMAPRTLQILTNRVKKCKTVSKSIKERWKCKKAQCFCRVSKRIKTCQKNSRVSKRVKKVSKKYQKSVKNVSKRVKKYRGAVFRVKTCQKICFLTLFDTFFDTGFCLLGCPPRLQASTRPRQSWKSRQPWPGA